MANTCATILGVNPEQRTFLTDVSYSERKCREHLARAKLALVLSTASSHDDHELAKHASLVGLAVGATDDVVGRVAEALTRSLFLDLKVNFELFLWTMCRVWLRHDLVETMRRLVAMTPQPKALKDLLKQRTIAQAFSSPDSVMFLPSQGLSILTMLLNSMTPGASVDDVNGWAQVKVAFEVRHLVEHRNGRVDDSFARSVAPFWELSSWNRQTRPAVNDIVQVQAVDFEQTYAAMDISVQHVATKVRAGWDLRTRA